MTLINYIFLSFLGLVAGFITSAGIFAFVTIIGVLTRLSLRTGTANHILHYEDLVVLGVAFGNSINLFSIHVPLGIVGFIFFGFFTGCYVGCLAVALEEVLQVFPIISHRIKLKSGVSILVLLLALGKLAGTLYELIFAK